MISTLYRGSVKDVLGPVSVPDAYSRQAPGAIFRFSDAYSVFDWGRMPDLILQKGAALAVMGSSLFERIEDSDEWKSFSKSQIALALRKGISAIQSVRTEPESALGGVPESLGAAFNEVGERLQQQGMKTHYRGLIHSDQVGNLQENQVVESVRLQDLRAPVDHLVVRQVSVVKPKTERVMGRAALDYQPTRASSHPRLIPLEVVFRFGCPEGSSFLRVAKRDPDYVSGLPVPASMFAGGIEPGVKWDFPVIELFTKLEPSDRRVSLTEALAISGTSSQQLQSMILNSIWLAGFLKDVFARYDLRLEDGKLEWGISEDGEIFLVDAIGPDELRLLKNGVQLSKEIVRTQYRDTPWYKSLKPAMSDAKSKGVSDWKKLVSELPPQLPPRFVEAISRMYMSLANTISEKIFFPEASMIDGVVEELKRGEFQ